MEELQKKKTKDADTSWTLGLLSLMFNLFLPIVALILGIIGILKSRSGLESDNASKAKTGRLMSIIGVAISAFLMIVFMVIMSIGNGTPSNYATSNITPYSSSTMTSSEIAQSKADEIRQEAESKAAESKVAAEQKAAEAKAAADAKAKADAEAKKAAAAKAKEADFDNKIIGAKDQVNQITQDSAGMDIINSITTKGNHAYEIDFSSAVATVGSTEIKTLVNTVNQHLYKISVENGESNPIFYYYIGGMKIGENRSILAPDEVKFNSNLN